MNRRDRRTVAKAVASRIAVAGVLAVSAAVACTATAAADPPPGTSRSVGSRPPPAPVPQSGQPAGPRAFLDFFGGNR